MYLPRASLRIRSGKIPAISPCGNGLVKPKYNFPAGMATGYTEPLPDPGGEITFRAVGAGVFGILSRAGPDEFNRMQQQGKQNLFNPDCQRIPQNNK